MLTVLGKKGIRWLVQHIDNFPIVKPNTLNNIKIAKVITLVLSLCENKRNNKNKVLELENQIDQLVYQLYDLNQEEIDLIERTILDR